MNQGDSTKGPTTEDECGYFDASRSADPSDGRVAQPKQSAEVLPALITREHAFRAAQNAVRNQGYAVALHGSQVKDLDLIAVPWQETAITAKMCAEIIAKAIPGEIVGPPEEKPYGRVAWTIYPKVAWGFDRWYVDLSVMPRQGTEESAERDAETFIGEHMPDRLDDQEKWS